MAIPLIIKRIAIFLGYDVGVQEGNIRKTMAARGLVNGYSKRKTRVFSIIFRCRFFERTSHIVDFCCAQRGVPPLAARPSPEKFFIVSMIMATRMRITPSRTMLLVYNIRLLLAGDVD